MKTRLLLFVLLFLFAFRAYPILTKPVLSKPADNEKYVSTCPSIQATSGYGSAKYQFEYATNPQFNNSTRVWSYDGGNVGFGYTLPLDLNTQYYWRARIFTTNDSSVWTDSRTFTTDTIIHLLGPDDKYNNVSPGIYFSLARNKKYSAYLIECDTASDFSTANKCSKLIADTFSWFYIETRLSCIRFRTTYYWRLKGFNNTDTSEWSKTRTFNTSDTVRIYNPAPLLTNARTNVKIELAMDRFLSHQIQYDTLPDFSSPNNMLILPSDYQDYNWLKSLHFDQKYYWRVRSCATTDTASWTFPRIIETTGFKNKTAISTSSSPIPPENTFIYSLADSAMAYQIQADLSPTFDSPFLIDSIRSFDTKKTYGQNTSVVFTDIPFNKSLYLRIRPMHAADTGAWSNTFSRATLSTARTYYPYNNQTDVPVGSLFQFQSFATIEGYRIQLDVSSSFNSPGLFDSTYAFGNYASLPKLNYNTRYYWRLTYIRKGDTSLWSPAAMFTTQIAPVLKSPLQLHLSGPGVQALLDWDSMPGSEQYEIMLDTSQDFSSPVAANLYQNGIASYIEVKHLFFGKYYYWKVRAMHSKDTSEWSATWFFTTYGKPNLDWPKNNQINISFSSLDWNSINGTEGYEYYLSKDSLFTESWHGYETKTNPFFHYFDKNPTEFNTRYFWKIRVFHAKDTSNWSDVWKFTTRPRNGVILQLPANNQQNVALGTTLTWEAVSNATQYVVSISENEDLSSPEIFSPSGRQLAVSLKPNQRYYWNVIAKNKDGVFLTDTSVTFQFTTATTFAVPSLISPANAATMVPLNNVAFSWSAIEGATYDIQFSLDAAFSSPQTQSTGQTLLYVSAFQNNRTYYWRVRAKNKHTNGPWSSGRSFQTIFGASVDDEQTENPKVYPNPAQEGVFIKNLNTNNAMFRIYSGNGQLVLDGVIENGYIALAGLPKGIYRLVLWEDGVEQSMNIAIMK